MVLTLHFITPPYYSYILPSYFGCMGDKIRLLLRVGDKINPWDAEASSRNREEHCRLISSFYIFSPLFSSGLFPLFTFGLIPSFAFDPFHHINSKTWFNHMGFGHWTIVQSGNPPSFLKSHSFGLVMERFRRAGKVVKVVEGWVMVVRFPD